MSETKANSKNMADQKDVEVPPLNLFLVVRNDAKEDTPRDENSTPRQGPSSEVQSYGKSAKKDAQKGEARDSAVPPESEPSPGGKSVRGVHFPQ